MPLRSPALQESKGNKAFFTTKTPVGRSGQNEGSSALFIPPSCSHQHCLPRLNRRLHENDSEHHHPRTISSTSSQIRLHSERARLCPASFLLPPADYLCPAICPSFVSTRRPSARGIVKAEPSGCEENMRSYKTAHVPILAAEGGHFAD